jgi:hypothetical protein
MLVNIGDMRGGIPFRAVDEFKKYALSFWVVVLFWDFYS